MTYRPLHVHDGTEFVLVGDPRMDTHDHEEYLTAEELPPLPPFNPVGPAGGDLTGTYPNPQIAAGTITDSDISNSAAIAQSKVAGLTTVLDSKTDTAGAGLTKTGTTMDVGAGTGITVNADNVAVNTAYTDARYVNTDGDTMTDSLIFTGHTSYGAVEVHSLATDQISFLSAQELMFRVTTPGANVANFVSGDMDGLWVASEKMVYLSATDGISAGGSVVNNVADPVATTDAANKQYVDKRLRWVPYTGTGQSFQKNDVTRDGTWTMVANKATSQQPSPVITGPTGFLLGDWTPVTDKAKPTYTVRNTWTLSSSGYVEMYGVIVLDENLGFSHLMTLLVNGAIVDQVDFIPDEAGDRWRSMSPRAVASGTQVAVQLRVTSPPVGNPDLYWAYQTGWFGTLPVYCSAATGSKDGGAQTSTAYGTRIQFTPATMPVDWDVLAYGGSVGGGGGGGGGGGVTEVYAQPAAPTGISNSVLWVDTDDLAPASPAYRYAVTLGTGLTQTVTHNLGTLDVMVTVYRLSDGLEVDVPCVHSGTNTINLNSSVDLAGHRVVVMR